MLDGAGSSGLDADLLDGYHAGYKNGNLALYINFPKITDLQVRLIKIRL